MLPFRRLLALTGLALLATNASADYPRYKRGQVDDDAVIRFKPPFKVMDPNFYADTLDSFKRCVKTCTVSSSYNTDAWASFGVLGDYTACVSSCVATETLNVVRFYKSSFGKLFNVGVNQLKNAKTYIAGSNDFNVLANRTRIDHSCCLPDEYFVDWDKVLIPVAMYFDDSDNWGESSYPFAGGNFVPIDYYIKHCSKIVQDVWVDEPVAVDDTAGAGDLKLYCIPSEYAYYSQLKASLGHNIIHPKYAQKVPDGACNANLGCHPQPVKPNPKGVAVKNDVCVAYKIKHINKAWASENDEDNTEVTYLTTTLIRPTDASGKCPDIEIPTSWWWWGDYDTMIVSFKKQAAKDCPYFTVNGLPKAEEYGCSMNMDFPAIVPEANPGFISGPDGDCLIQYEYRTMFVEYDNREEFHLPPKYRDGPVEYCNVKQYANHLTRQLYDLSKCYLYGEEDFYNLPYWSWWWDWDWGWETEDDRALDNFKNFFNDRDYTIACLYRIFSLKCDCMQAVVNCYSNEAEFTTALGKTLGRAASILCGFLLCQDPRIFSLFGDQSGVRHSTIMKEILLQTGVMDPTNSLPMASIAFLSFGLGMVAFIVTKRAYGMYTKRNMSTMEDGYRNLI